MCSAGSTIGADRGGVAVVVRQQDRANVRAARLSINPKDQQGSSQVVHKSPKQTLQNSPGPSITQI